MPAKTPFRLPEIDTRFALPIICPKTGEIVSAETLYNRASDAMGHAIEDHIGDLVLDNLNYDLAARVPNAPLPCISIDDEALCDSIYAWADSVRAKLAASS